MKRGNIRAIARYLLVAMLLSMGATSCDVHEFPDTNYTLLLNCELIPLPVHEEIYLSKQTSNAKAEHDRRFVIKAYHSDDGKDFSTKPDTTVVCTRNIDEDRILPISLSLQEGFYKFIVWGDCVDRGSSADKYYNTTDFAKITYIDRENYEGCNDFKDAFRGEELAQVYYDPYGDGNQVTTVSLERPLAKFQFIATDLEEFIKREELRLSSKGEDEEPRSVNPADYRVVFYYTGFMPCTFNAFTNNPIDSWTNVSFDGNMIPLENHESELGFDYVLVNGAETKVNVVAEVYYKTGELLSRTKTVEVPLVRSKLTVVRGPFLTSMATGGVDIDTDYDGDINIFIY